jgi:phosphinothricin acetyltransferase
MTKDEMKLHINYSKYCVVITEDELVMGYGYISSFSKKAGYNISGVLTIYLDQYRKGAGSGKKILFELEKVAKQIGMNQLYAIISHTNDRSLEFFKRKGYKEVAVFDKVAYKHGQQIDVLYLRNMLK